MRLRSNTTTQPAQWQGVDKKDFGDTVYMLSELHRLNKDRDKYNTKKDNALKFNPEEVAAWVKAKNNEIARIIRERKDGTRD